MDPFVRLVRALLGVEVRFVVVGVWGANYYARSGSTVFTTADRDLFLPPNSENLLRAWSACESTGMALSAGNEPLDLPRDLALARAVVARRGLTTALGEDGLEVDLGLVMSGFDFDAAWDERRTFVVDEVEVPVARLAHIVTSKAEAGREKDRLFLATHAEQLRRLIDDDAES